MYAMLTFRNPKLSRDWQESKYINNTEPGTVASLSAVRDPIVQSFTKISPLSTRQPRNRCVRRSSTPERTGFLSSVLSSLLNLRIETKRLKKTNKDYAGIDSVLKWMLVTCFGYTGYRKRQVRSAS